MATLGILMVANTGCDCGSFDKFSQAAEVALALRAP